MSKIGKHKAIQDQIDASAKAVSMPFPANISTLASIKFTTNAIMQTPEDQFNDDGTINLRSEDCPVKTPTESIHGTVFIKD